MASASCATNLGTLHAKGVVADRHQVFFRKWRGKARPAGATFEFLVCHEQRQPAELAAIDPGLLVVEKNTAKRLLGAVVQQHVPLLSRERSLQGSPLLRCRRREIEVGTGH